MKYTPIVIALVLTACTESGETAAKSSVRLIGEHVVTSGQTYHGVAFGGISAIDRGADDTYYLLSDDGSRRAPSRMVRARITVAEAGFGEVEFVETVTLAQPDGSLFPAASAGVPADPEAMRFHAETGTLYWASEGNRGLGSLPFLREMNPRGEHLRTLSVPPMFLSVADDRGARPNGSFEGLALNADGHGLLVAMELPLIEDGPLATVESPAFIRLTALDLNGETRAQYAYPLEPIAEAPEPPDGFALNGVTEVLAVDSERYLVLERAYSAGRGNTVRLFEVSVRDATDVSAFSTLLGMPFVPTRKRELVDFGDLALSRVDNLEGMTWGPRLRNGNRSLIVVSDDNFNEGQVTQFIALEYVAGR